MSGYLTVLVVKLLLWHSLVTLDAIAYQIRHFGRCKYNQNITGNCQNLDDCNTLTKSQKNDESFMAKHKCFTAEKWIRVCCPTETFEDPDATSNSGSKIALPVSPYCGHMIKDKISHGIMTEPGDYPWMVLIITRNGSQTQPNTWANPTDIVESDDESIVCGGVLINDRWVLTAAHCHNGSCGRITAVRLGEWNTATDEDCITGPNNIRECLPPHIDVNVDRVVQHNLYRRFEIKYDIALVRMWRSISITQYIKPICLPVETHMRTDMYENSMAYIAGWGRTEDNKISDWKLEANLTISARNVCEESYKTKLDDSIMCASGTAGMNSCSGDSGGPLMLERKAYYAIGVISHGNWGCRGNSLPIAFTRVAPFMDWIQDTIKSYNDGELDDAIIFRD